MIAACGFGFHCREGFPCLLELHEASVAIWSVAAPNLPELSNGERAKRSVGTLDGRRVILSLAREPSRRRGASRHRPGRDEGPMGRADDVGYSQDQS